MKNMNQEFYNSLASDYHLIASTWDTAVKEQGKILNSLLQTLGLTGSRKILDCSCGIGTQAIGLAMFSHEVNATDLSSKSVERAKHEAVRLGVQIKFGVADFRSLVKDVPGLFEIIISFDNSIPHLLSEADLSLAASNMFQKLKPGGTIMISTRDYNKIVLEKPTGMPPRKIIDEHGERVYLQTWDWNKQGDSYELELFLLKRNSHGWDTSSYKTQYRAWQRHELSSIFEKVGFKNIQWLMPEETGYYQPIMIAHTI
jgi:glycine/sarcosine N-methyltransferase